MLQRFRPTSLWRNANFMKLWFGSTVSLFGSQITFLALPFTAALVLHANAAQMGFLVTAESLPSLLVGLFVGVWVDRLRRRPVLIVTDCARALLLAAIPVLALAGWLRIEYLYAIAFLLGLCTLVFQVAYGAFLPSVVARERLVEGNSKLEVSNSLSQLAGPGLAGWLIQALTAPVAIVVDAFSFLVSAFALLSLRVRESSPTATKRQGFWRDLGDGLKIVVHNPVLRVIALSGATLNFFGGIMDVVRVLYFIQVLGLGAAFFGIMFTIADISGLGAALINGWLLRRLGLGPLILVSAMALGLGWLLIPLAGGPFLVKIGLIVLGALLFGFGNTTFNLNELSLRQAITPDHLLGRVGACMDFIGVGTLPLGALLGGYLGGVLGLRPTFLLAGCGIFCAFLWTLLSPVLKIRTIASAVETDSHDSGSPEEL